MNLRKVTLWGLLVALGLCALGGMYASAVSHGEGIAGVLLIALAVAIAAGCVFPLTFLVDRPHYRAGGLAAIILVVFLLLDISSLIAIEFWRFSYGYRTEDILAGGMGVLLATGLPTVGGLMVQKYAWAKYSASTLAIVACFSLMIVLVTFGCALVSTGVYEFTGALLGSAMIIYGTGFLAAMLLVNVRCGDRRYFRWPAIAIDVLLLFVVVIEIASEQLPVHHESHDALIGSLFSIVGFFALLNLILMAPDRGVMRWVKLVTITVALFTCCAFILASVERSEIPANLGIATLILTVCLAISLIVIALLQKRFDYREDKAAELLTHIEIKCPRCEKEQRLPFGDSTCEGCGLRFLLKAIEPRCAECGYLLYGITSPRCPECGAVLAGVKHPSPGEMPSGATPATAAS